MRLTVVWMLSLSALRAVHSQRAGPDSTRLGSISGTIRDERNAPIPGARVSVAGYARAAYSNGGGEYRYSLPPGKYILNAQRLGYAASVAESVSVRADSTTVQDFVLRTAAVPLSQVIISPGSYALLDAPGPSLRSVSRETLQLTPSLVEDLFRSLNRLPGMSGSDFGAKVRIRNGGADEQLVLLDGLELIEPFHLKDFDGALSILDTDALGGVSITTGGFGARYGDRLTGVIDMTSASPRDGRPTSALGLSISNLRARSQGSFGRGRGAWLLSARRGYLDIVFNLVGEENPPDPKYFDLFGKVQYQLGDRHLLTVHGLLAQDKMRLTDDDEVSYVRSSYGNGYAWATLRDQLSPRVSVATMLSLSALSWKRTGQNFELFARRPYEASAVRDARTLDVLAIKQDWDIDFSPRVGLLLGGEVRSESADYRYQRQQRTLLRLNGVVFAHDSLSVAAHIAPDGNRTSGYGVLRVRPVDAVTLEAGMRADRHSWTRQSTVAPRFSAAWAAGDRTTLRGTWGRYYQAHALQDLAIVDGDTVFHLAELAEHRVVGAEHELNARWRGRMELYERQLGAARARYYNTDGQLDALPEGSLDRLRFAPDSARVRGAEVSVTFEPSQRVRAQASYSLSRATAHVGRTVTPRPFDERHAATADLAINNRKGWSWAFAWTFHTGWPLVPPTFVVDSLAPNAFVTLRVPSPPDFRERLDSYHRLDLRVSRDFDTRRGRVGLFADIFNILNTTNHRGYAYGAFVDKGRAVVTREREEFLGRLPTIGVRWEFR